MEHPISCAKVTHRGTQVFTGMERCTSCGIVASELEIDLNIASWRIFGWDESWSNLVY